MGWFNHQLDSWIPINQPGWLMVFLSAKGEQFFTRGSGADAEARYQQVQRQVGQVEGVLHRAGGWWPKTRGGDVTATQGTYF